MIYDKIYKIVKKGEKMKKNKLLFVILFLLIILVVIIVVINNRQNNNNNTNNTENTEANTTLNQVDNSNTTNEVVNQVANQTTNEVAKTTAKEEFKSDLDRCTDPKYKIGEKELRIPILIYHAFQTPLPPNEGVYALFSCQEDFEDNVKTIQDAGFTFITLEDIYKYKNGEIGLPEKNVCITMDDGWIGEYEEAYPILQKYQIPATIFIVDQLVGTENYFTWEQAKEMYDSNLVKIYAHGYRHVDYGNADKATLQDAYETTHKHIEEHLGAKVQKIMAYPSGSSTENSIAWLKEIGFEVQVQTKYGTVNKSSTLDLTDLGRVRAERPSSKTILNAIS